MASGAGCSVHVGRSVHASHAGRHSANDSFGDSNGIVFGSLRRSRGVHRLHWFEERGIGSGEPGDVCSIRESAIGQCGGKCVWTDCNRGVAVEEGVRSDSDWDCFGIGFGNCIGADEVASGELCAQ